MANEEIVWNPQKRANTLAALDMLKSFCKGEAPALTTAMLRVVEDVGIEGILAGYNNVCLILIKDAATRLGIDRMDVLYSIENLVKSIKIAE